MSSEKMKLGVHRGVKKVLEEMEGYQPEKPTAKPKPIQILMTPEEHAKFKTLCYMRGVKMTEISVQLIREWMDKEKGNTPWLK